MGACRSIHSGTDEHSVLARVGQRYGGSKSPAGGDITARHAWLSSAKPVALVSAASTATTPQRPHLRSLGSSARSVSPVRALQSSKDLFTITEGNSIPRTPAGLFRWKRGDRIGGGSSADVYLGLCVDTGTLMAVKEIPLPCLTGRPGGRATKIASMQRELNLLQKVQHRHVIKFLGSELRSKKLCLFTEYLSGGTLRRLIRKFGALNEALAARYTRHMLLALEYLHSEGVVHCDVKCSNVLLDEQGRATLADFGDAMAVSPDGWLHEGGHLHGTPRYLAPETISGRYNGAPRDVWAVGCSLVYMLTGRPPWRHMPIKDVQDLLSHIHSTEETPLTPEIEAGLSDTAVDFLRHILRRDPLERASAAQLLRHPFVTQNADTPGHSRRGSESSQVLNLEGRDDTVPAGELQTNLEQILNDLDVAHSRAGGGGGGNEGGNKAMAPRKSSTGSRSLRAASVLDTLGGGGDASSQQSGGALQTVGSRPAAQSGEEAKSPLGELLISGSQTALRLRHEYDDAGSSVSSNASVRGAGKHSVTRNGSEHGFSAPSPHMVGDTFDGAVPLPGQSPSRDMQDNRASKPTARGPHPSFNPPSPPRGLKGHGVRFMKGSSFGVSRGSLVSAVSNVSSVPAGSMSSLGAYTLAPTPRSPGSTHRAYHPGVPPRPPLVALTGTHASQDSMRASLQASQRRSSEGNAQLDKSPPATAAARSRQLRPCNMGRPWSDQGSRRRVPPRRPSVSR